MVHWPISRVVAAVVVTLVVVTTGACSEADPIAEYVADVRAALAPADSASVDDNGIIYAGKAICEMRDQVEASPAAFGYAEMVEVALRNCAVLAAAQPNPGSGYPANVEEGLAGEAEANAGEAAGLTDRGALPAQIGQRIEQWGPPMAAGVGQYVTVTAIRPVTACKGQDIGDQGQSIPAKPENGRFLAVDMKIENTRDYDTAQSGYYAGTAQRYDFVTPDGHAIDQVDTLVAFYCTGEEDSFSDLKPGRTYTGTKYIDVPKSGGWLIFGQSQFIGPGYEIQIPPA